MALVRAIVGGFPFDLYGDAKVQLYAHTMVNMISLKMNISKEQLL